MDTPTTHDPTDDHRCRADLGRCGVYRPGHLLHPIHARLLGEPGGGWRRGIVERLEGREVLLSDPTGHVVAAWHHRLLSDVLEPGVSVLMHERLHALAVREVVANVRLTGSSTPGALNDTATAVGPIVIDLATGRGVTTFT